MAGRRRPPQRVDDDSHPSFPGLQSLGKHGIADVVRTVGPRVAFYSVVAAGAFYAMAHGANVMWAAGFGAYITALFELSEWLRKRETN
jgi:hypothetical protein